MRILAANLSHFVRSPRLLLFTALSVLYAVIVAGWGGLDMFFLCALLPAWTIGIGLKDVICKPFSYCLPGHVSLVRPIVFGSGILVSSVLVLSLRAELGGAGTMLAAFAVCLAFFSLFALLVLRAAQPGNYFVLCLVPAALVPVFGTQAVDTYVRSFDFGSPAPLALGSVAVAVLALIGLDGRRLARWNLGRPTLGLGVRWNHEEPGRYRVALDARRGDRARWVDGLVSLMMRPRTSPLLRNVLGTVCQLASPSAGFGQRGLLVLVFLVPLAGYAGDLLRVVIPWITAMFVSWPFAFRPRLKVRLPIGRREGFIEAVLTSFLGAAIAGLLFLFWAVISRFAAPFMPALGELTYIPLDPAVAYFALAIVPPFIALSAMGPTVLMSAFVLSGMVVGVAWRGQAPAAAPVTVIAFSIVAWALTAGVFHHRFFRRSLI